MHVSVAFLRALQSVLSDLGQPVDESFALPSDGHASLSWDTCMHRLSSTLSRCQNPELGVLAGQRMSVGALHLLGNLLLTARSLREAEPLVSRYVPLLFGGASFVLMEAGEEAAYAFTPPPCDLGAERFCAQLVLAVTANVGHAIIVSSGQLKRAEFRHSRPAQIEAYERVFGCELVFGAAENRLVISRHLLDEARRLPDESLGELLRERADRWLEVSGERRDVVARLGDHLRIADLAEVSPASAATALGMSASTLRRRLEERSLCFSDLVDDCRKELALELLRDGITSIKEMSARLGFSEARAFHRAFRRWTGTTPANFRALRATG